MFIVRGPSNDGMNLIRKSLFLSLTEALASAALSPLPRTVFSSGLSGKSRSCRVAIQIIAGMRAKEQTRLRV